MGVAVTYLGLMCVPWLAYYALHRALDRWSAGSPRRGRSGTELEPDLDDLLRSLRRLQEEYATVEVSDLPARAARLRALSTAYDEVLRTCCRRLGLPEPPVPPLRPVDRLQAEAALAGAGLDW